MLFPSRALDRRVWLKLGGLSVGALSSGFGPGLHSLFAAEAAGQQPDREFSVILFWANGGPSHLDTFDLKPEAPEEVRGPFRPAVTNVPGISLCERLPELAKRADKFALVRSLFHNRGEHSGGTHRFLTGYSSLAANLQDAEFPDVGSLVAKELDHRTTDVPVYVGNTKFYGGGPGYLGKAYAPFHPDPNPLTSTGNNSYDPVPLNPTASSLSLDAEGSLTLRRRETLLRDLDSFRRSLDRTSDSFDRFQKRAIEMLAGAKVREAFNLNREDPKIRERYGPSEWGTSLLTARRLVEAGVRFVQCQANLRLDPAVGRTTTWDDHSVNVDIFQAMEARFPVFDRAVSALIDDLHAKGLNDRVLFLFCGEFGRTPRIEKQDASRRPGRDHWPRAMSVLLSGGGLRMGQVIGSTNARGEDPKDRRMDSNCLLATIYNRFGIDTRHTHTDRTGRPIPILPHGEPIAELHGPNTKS